MGLKSSDPAIVFYLNIAQRLSARKSRWGQKLETDSLFHVISAVFIFAAAAIPIYLSFKLRDKFRKLVIALAIFIVFHGVYHIFGSMGKDFLSSSVFEPISAMALLAFGAMYLIAVRDVSNRKKRQERLNA